MSKTVSKRKPNSVIYHNHCNPCEVNVKTSYIICTLQECMYICTNFKHIIKLYILKFFFKKSKTIQNSVTSVLLRASPAHLCGQFRSASPPFWQTRMHPPHDKCGSHHGNADFRRWSVWITSGVSWCPCSVTRCPQCHLTAIKALVTIYGFLSPFTPCFELRALGWSPAWRRWTGRPAPPRPCCTGSLHLAGNPHCAALYSRPQPWESPSHLHLCSQLNLPLY